MRIIPTLMGALLIGLAATPAAAGSIGSIKVDSSVEWESDCQLPTRPDLSFHDIEGYNQALAQFNIFVARVSAYIQCVQSDGQADIDALAAAVASSMRAKQDAALKSTEVLRTDLEVHRSLLR